jgi:hypothetical protein
MRRLSGPGVGRAGQLGWAAVPLVRAVGASVRRSDYGVLNTFSPSYAGPLAKKCRDVD